MAEIHEQPGTAALLGWLLPHASDDGSGQVAEASGFSVNPGENVTNKEKGPTQSHRDRRDGIIKLKRIALRFKEFTEE